MFRFSREKILPMFLQRGITITELARQAGVCSKSAYRAVNGLDVSAPVVSKIAVALNSDALDLLANPAQKEEDAKWN